MQQSNFATSFQEQLVLNGHKDHAMFGLFHDGPIAHLLERRARKELGVSAGALVDWSKVDWSKIFSTLFSLFLKFLPLLLAL